MFALAKMVDAYGSQVWTWIGGEPTLFVAEDVEVLQARTERERARPLVVVPEREIATFKGAHCPDLFAFAMRLDTFQGDYKWRWIKAPEDATLPYVTSKSPEDVALYTEDAIPKARAVLEQNMRNLCTGGGLAIVPSYEVAAFRDSIVTLNKT